MTVPNFDPRKIGLAPMEGVSDFPFRLWMHLVSAPAFSCTPFLRVTNGFPKKGIPAEFAPELYDLKDSCPYELIPQLMTSDAQDFIRVAKDLLQVSPYVDLNCGCPSPNAVGGGAGSSMLRDPTHLRQVIKDCLEALGEQRVSLKIRSGYECHSELFSILDQISDLPLHHLTIHGRTRRQRYDGFSRWDLISEAASRVSFPVWASGDIHNVSSIDERKDLMKHSTKIIIGRGALRNPWIFGQLSQSTNITTVSSSDFPFMLAVLGILYELKMFNFDKLIAFAHQVFEEDLYQVEDRKWESIYQKLVWLAKGSQISIDELSFERFALGRVKMIWNYLRSGLPQPFFDPTILRAKNFTTLIQRIQVHSFELPEVTPNHTPSLDWVYTSSKKDPRITHPLYT